MNCVNSIAANARHFVECVSGEIYTRNAEWFHKGIRNPVVTYTMEPAPSIEEATRITQAFERCIHNVQVIFDSTAREAWTFTGVCMARFKLFNGLCEQIFDRDVTPEQAEQWLDNELGDMQQ